MNVGRRKVTISHHAKIRLGQRAPDKLGYPNIEQLAAAARYKGELLTLGRRFSRTIKTLFRGYIFIYQYTRTSWELVTVYPLQKNI